mgnify:CR=1 FL=1
MAWKAGSPRLSTSFAVAVFLLEQRKERDNEDEAAYQLLSDAYNDFLKVVLAHPVVSWASVYNLRGSRW